MAVLPQPGVAVGLDRLRLAGDSRQPDRLARHHNSERNQRGDRLRGRMPAQAQREALAMDVLPEIIPVEEEVDQSLPAAA